MQFISKGPDIPERLLQAHEDGRVVFFCGAGISYPARLPGFSGLAAKLYESLSVTPNSVQQSAIDTEQFDTAIGLLEAGVVGGRETVRSKLGQILAPDLTVPGATATHEALLTLSKNREGRTRLITTNFDRLFEHVREVRSLTLSCFQAPLLRVPKARWDGLIYLHGLLPSSSAPDGLHDLVISSGDFGRAYLTERWAARFVSELFRRFTVCFVGYSINDPVLRYMMDALAADRLLGEFPPEMFAFGGFADGEEARRDNEWRAKNVSPILYRETADHGYLHNTLRAWADTYRDGVRGKERIVVESAIAHPLASTKEDNFVGRMLWALSDPRGLPAKRFSEIDPVPTLDWLEPLCKGLYGHTDLARFGVPSLAVADDGLSFSLTRRPAPYTRAPWMAIADAKSTGSQWDDVMVHLAHWLTRHLDDPKLILWFARQGGRLHDQMNRQIEWCLSRLFKLETDGDAVELGRIRTGAPNAIPGPAMRTLWRLLLNRRVKAGGSYLNLFSWREQFRRDGPTASVRVALREFLAPCVSLREPFRWSADGDTEAEQVRVKDLVEWEVVLASDHVHSLLDEFPKDARWTAALPELLAVFSALLHDALDLMAELGGANEKNDRSFVHQPSIAEHPQNQKFHDWTALIDLTRDAWLTVAKQSPDRARIAAEVWAQGPYPIFRRLAFFAATHDWVIPLRMALDWLLANDGWWLWSTETERESMRLLVSLAPRLDAAMLAELERVILLGPPRDMFREDVEPNAWEQIIAHSIWLRLAKAAQAGAELGDGGRARLAAIGAQYPLWRLAADESDEFPIWSGGAEWLDDRDPMRPYTALPRTSREVLGYLRARAASEEQERDDWRKRCSESFRTTAIPLWRLTRENIWPVQRWRDALQAWAEDGLLKRSWRYMGPILAGAPDEVLKDLAQSAGWWLNSVAKTFQGHEAHFLGLARRILQMDVEGGSSDSDDPVFSAINHPIGYVTQSLLDWWFRQEPKDGETLPDAIKPVFTELCDTTVDRFRNARVLLAAHVLSLFRVDRAWTEHYLLPLFYWTSSEVEARAAWEGFMWSPRLYRPLMEALRPAFLDTASRYERLGKHKESYAAFLTFAALDPGDTFKTRELAQAIRALPAEGLQHSARALVRALEGAGEQREEYWRNRVRPFWENIWPRTNDHAADVGAESLARLCIAAGEEFPDALAVVGNWLRPARHADFAVHLLHESGLSVRYPEEALRLLGAILSDDATWARDLRQCLNAIALKRPELQQDRTFTRLDELVRRSET